MPLSGKLARWNVLPRSVLRYTPSCVPANTSSDRSGARAPCCSCARAARVPIRRFPPADEHPDGSRSLSLRPTSRPRWHRRSLACHGPLLLHCRRVRLRRSAGVDSGGFAALPTAKFRRDAAMPNVSAERLTDIAKALLHAAGASTEEAATIARYNIGANLVGHDSHGIILIPTYIDRIKAGHIVPQAPWASCRRPRPALSSTATGVWLRRHRPRDALHDRQGEEQQVAAATVFRQSHIGRLAVYPLLAAREGMIAMITADSGRSAKAVAPFGGAKARLGTNPICSRYHRTWKAAVLRHGHLGRRGRQDQRRNRARRTGARRLADRRRGQAVHRSSRAAQGGALLPVGGSEGYKGYGSRRSSKSCPAC